MELFLPLFPLQGTETRLEREGGRGKGEVGAWTWGGAKWQRKLTGRNSWKREVLVLFYSLRNGSREVARGRGDEGYRRREMKRMGRGSGINGRAWGGGILGGRDGGF